MSQADITTLHGWAMHGGLFEELASGCPEARWHRMDLPGHGLRRGQPWPERAEALLDDVIERAPPGTWLMGWSLGGLLAIQAFLRRPAVFAGLLLIAANPRFAASDHWPHGADPALLKAMALELADKPESALVRFLALETRGSANSGEALRRLRARALQHGLPDKAALVAGLKHLAEADVTARLGEIAAPVLLIGGQRDRMVPWAALEAARDRLPDGRLVGIPDAAHAPFLTDRSAVAGAMRDFIAQRSPASRASAA